ncbi:hypothetical protein H7F10_09980 [Acidithiobacillus sp. HP-6]|uniref:hypothetical protein n=1 Tax=unclassified Acidithiobacillus TaxID=2614800 RepID=UPI00187A77E5|nr:MULTISPECIES: hypothetical protein [unclassified Acidithiobacillus]MBE7563267.1 hypothetical protein [Acidithiobacillus sp. HP-6]MBE7569376.1 hypothetical protein [Acidithiobacillus sp. HP-2]
MVMNTRRAALLDFREAPQKLSVADYRGVHFETYYGSQGVISLRQAHRVYVSPLSGIPH